MLKKIIAVVGPTASGKTALAIEIAKEFDGEIVSCDSMQIYEGMDVGTAKPTKEEMEQIPHHMIDIATPWENYSVADFTQTARTCIEDILSRGKTPVLAGGTGLYVDSILQNIVFDEYESDPEFRDAMQKIAETKGAEEVHRLLAEKDKEAADKIHPNNVRRVIRALEVCHLTGKTFTQVNLEARKEPLYDALILGIDTDREVLYERINVRVDKMIEDGLLEEVKSLKDKGVNRETTAMQAIGYKELFDYLEGTISFDDSIEKIKMESRRYAKRQLTWFRRNEEINWVSVQKREDIDEIIRQCGEFLSK